MNELLDKVAQFGQSIWIDQLRRAMITSGEIERLIDEGVVGITSNPTIFEKAISGSADYDASLRALLAADGHDADKIYEQLVLKDISGAADLLRPVYDRTGAQDGYVSLEVRPTLAADKQGSIAEARRLFQALGRPNVMIKIPATPEGIPAIETLTAEGININVTLIFSVKQYEAVVGAYLSGLEKRLAAGEDIRYIASVASFFVSRVDTTADQALEKIGASELLGQIAVANAKVAYARFRELFQGERWEKLARAGARLQRPLWASTSVKNHNYPDTLYVEQLIGPDTVNTIPPAALNAFLDHGRATPTLEDGLDDARTRLLALERLGIDLGAITEHLQVEGVESFTRSFLDLTAGIAGKLEQLDAGWQPLTSRLGNYQAAVERALDGMKQKKVMERLWAHDHTLWKPKPVEITNRLGWLHVVETMQESLPGLKEFAEGVQADGYTQVVLLGMGGSSLAPEVFSRTFGAKKGYPGLSVLDSTDPGAILDSEAELDLARTLFIVSTKSGTTVETLSFFKYFYNRVAEAIGPDQAGDHFIAITDAGTRLENTARQLGFRKTFLNDPNIGGRYAALSYVGLAPAALLGMDLELLLDRALRMACNSEGCNVPVDGDNLGAELGAILGELALSGRDKLTLVLSPAIASFGDWVEQLLAESTGKEGRGIFPVVGEAIGTPDNYGDDRLFVNLCLVGDDRYDGALEALEKAGHPVVRLELKDVYDLGGQFFLWEIATAVAGHRLEINPFDQPDVEASKILARQAVATYEKEGRLPELEAGFQFGGIKITGDTGYADQPLKTGGAVLGAFLRQANPGDYLAIQAYLQPTPEVEKALQTFRQTLRERTRLATSRGYGPRFLHSTGQLHKGDRGNGLFIQITADALQDIPIPDEAGRDQSSITFGTLELAQAMGDRQALLSAGRRMLNFHLGLDILGGLRELASWLSNQEE